MYFIEKLTLSGWLFSVLPRLLFRRLKTGRSPGHCYFIDGSCSAILGATATAWIGGVSIEKLRFRLVDVRDEKGLLIRLRITYQDLAQVQADAMREPVFRDLVQGGKLKGRLLTYLAKSIASANFLDRGTLWRALLLVQTSAWKRREEGNRSSQTILFLEHRPWLQAITRYAARYGIQIVPLRSSYPGGRALTRRILGLKGVEALRAARHRFHLLQRGRQRHAFQTSSQSPASSDAMEETRRLPSTPRLAVEYMEHLNVVEPERHSELFFWQQSSIPGSDLIVLLHLLPDPPDQKWLTRHGIATLALNPQAATNPTVPLFTPRLFREGATVESPGLVFPYKSIEAKWLEKQIFSYWTLRGYWGDLFAREKVKVYVTWFRYDATHCAIADALHDLGGITAIYQRAFQPDPSAEITVDADIMFGYSQADAKVECRSNSIIPYHVAVGYLGDHRFPLLRESAQNVRYQLKSHGAKRIMAFFDENSADDSRWHTGHELQRENYAFVLEKVLAEPWLGLVVKPKVSSTLRRRLGPVAELLKRAEATGRCYVFENGTVRSAYPPAAAALASDLAIHGHLCAATAALEARLAGVPTLLMDREGWPVSSFYRLGVGKVVFTDWQSFWDALTEHWTRPGGAPGFGDWSPLLDELDPFRDGHAAQRMGTYVQWLIEGFKAGLDRETVMADAAERYCKRWGWDKVTEVGDRSWRRHGTEGFIASLGDKLVSRAGRSPVRIGS